MGSKRLPKEELDRIGGTLAEILSERIDQKYKFPYFIDDASKILKGLFTRKEFSEIFSGPNHFRN